MNGLKASADTQQQHKDLVLSQEVALVLQPFYLIPQCTSLQHKFSWVEMSLKALLPGTHFCSVLKSVSLLPHTPVTDHLGLCGMSNSPKFKMAQTRTCVPSIFMSDYPQSPWESHAI